MRGGARRHGLTNRLRMIAVVAIAACEGPDVKQPEGSDGVDGGVDGGADAPGVPHCTDVRFPYAQWPVTASVPTDILAEDLNRDGHADLVVASFGEPFITVALSRGDATFQPMMAYNVMSRADALAIAPARGDAGAMVAVVDFGRVRILVPDADGILRPNGDYDVGHATTAVAIADVDRDGLRDIIVTDAIEDDATVLVGHRDGTFRSGIGHATAAGPESLGVADLSGDGIVDLVVLAGTDGAGMVSVLIGNGDGTFRPRVDHATGSRPFALAVADLDADHKLDVVTADIDDGSLRVLIGDGRGGLQPSAVYPIGARARAIAAIDLSGDGVVDLAAVGRSESDPSDQPGAVSVLLGVGDGTFRPKSEYPTGEVPIGLAVSDMNGDGAPDLAVTNGVGASVSVLLNDGVGRFMGIPWYSVSAPQSLLMADVSGDGVPDLVTGTSAGMSVRIAGSDGTFQSELIYPTEGAPSAIVVEDVNRDRAADLMFAVASRDAIGTLLGRVDDPGTFHPVTSFGLGGPPGSLAVSDISGDGTPDLVVPMRSLDTVRLLVGDSGGMFQSRADYPTGGGPTAAVSADLNGDRSSDIVTANTDNGTVSVLLGNGRLSFQSKVDYPAGKRPSQLVVADAGRDGAQDIVVLNTDDDKVSVLLGRSNGTLAPVVSYAVDDAPTSLAVGDVSGDGMPDLVVGSERARMVRVLIGRVDGTFYPGARIGAGVTVSSLALTDVSGDGMLDMVASSSSANKVSVLQARCRNPHDAARQHRVATPVRSR
jgi:hypothetical protein